MTETLDGERERAATTALAASSVARMAVLLAVMSIPAVLDRGAISQAAGLYALAESSNPYWVPSHAFLLYARAPLVGLSACVLFLSPGLFLALAMGVARSVALWVLTGFMLSIVTISVAAAIVQSAIGAPLVDRSFSVAVLGCAAASLSLLWLRVRRGSDLPRPWAEAHAKTTLAVIGALTLFLLVGFAPKFYWESLNGDGAHTFEAARLLLRHPVPFFGPSAGHVSNFPGVTTMLYLYPASWFVRLFGETEAAVRLPFVLELAALFCAIVATAEQGRAPIRRYSRWLIALALVVFAVTLAYSATYSPYSADIALPATQDTLLVAMFLAYVVFFIAGCAGWMSLALVLTYLSLPSGLLLIMLWLAAVMLWRPRPWPLIIRSLYVVAGCVLVSAIFVRLLSALGVPGPGGEYGLVSLLRYFAFLQFTDWHRLLYAIVPAGFVPALALFVWRRHDIAARSLALVAVGYFGLFFIQGHIALHHFVPAMILPLAVFWRSADEWGANRRPAVLSAVAAGAVVALVLSLPRTAIPEATARRVGVTIDDRTPGYEWSDPGSFLRSELFANLFPLGWEPGSDKRLSGSPLVWLYYAHHAPAERVPNYVLQQPNAPAPPGMRLLVADNGAALYVLSDSVWRQHSALRPTTPPGSRTYAVPRGILFRSEPLPAGQRVYSVVNLLGSIGVDTAYVLKRLGVKR